jgi:hypothetical protein
MSENPDSSVQPANHPLRFWLILHPLTFFLVMLWGGVLVVSFRDQSIPKTNEWPIAVVFAASVLLWSFWKKLRGQPADSFVTLLGGGLMLAVGTLYWLDVFLRVRYGASGVFGLLGACVLTGLIADGVMRLCYLRALNRARQANGSTGAGDMAS